MLPFRIVSAKRYARLAKLEAAADEKARRAKARRQKFIDIVESAAGLLTSNTG